MIAATAPTGVLAANYARDRIALAALWLLAALLTPPRRTGAHPGGKGTPPGAPRAA